MLQKIRFVANRNWLSKEDYSAPQPSSKSLPSWYVSADRFAKDSDGNHHVGPDGGKILTWKSCPAIYDVLTSGYVYRTPCDIEFFINDSGKISAKVLDFRYSDFIQVRPPMPQFDGPIAYHEDHFAWYPDWAVEVPEGYSVLYSQPYDRYDLPFLTTSGIVDNDKVKLPGTMPFFVSKGWVGILPAGTPYAQIMPFKRESWESEHVLQSAASIIVKNKENSAKYRVPNGGVYLKDVWEKRKYE
jgi:hypothetical protein